MAAAGAADRAAEGAAETQVRARRPPQAPAPPQVRPPFVLPQVGAGPAPGGGLGPGARLAACSLPHPRRGPYFDPIFCNRNIFKNIFSSFRPQNKSSLLCSRTWPVRPAVKELHPESGIPKARTACLVPAVLVFRLHPPCLHSEP